MRQYQIVFENVEQLNKQLSVINNVCEEISFSDIIFYLTWTKSAQVEIASITDSIEKYFPDSAYYGNEASGNIAMGEFKYGVNITCYIFEEKTTKTELVWVEKGTSISSLEDLWNYCNEKKDLRGIELIPAISYLEELGIDRNVPDIDTDILIFGGASVNYDDATFGADIIAKGHPMTREGMAVLLYFGKDLHFQSTDVLGWKGLGKLMEVTSSTGKVIKEIDYVPAYSVYEKYLNLTMEDKDTLVFPLLAEEGENEFIRTPQIIQPDKSMLMFANVPEGSKVQISYGDKNTILNSLNNKAAVIAEGRPDAIKAYSCAARRLFWGDSEVGKETSIFQNIAPVCGFYTGGEILRFGNTLRVLNQTLAIVSFREGEGKKTDEQRAFKRIEDKSLLSRLTYFAEKIVEEEKQQRMLAEGFENSFKALYQVMYYIDLINGKATFLYGDENTKNFLSIFNTDSAYTMFSSFYKYYIDAVIEPEDRDRVKRVMNTENLFRSLKTCNSISVNYKVRRNLVDPVYTEMSIIKAGEKDGELSAIILAFKLSDEELRVALETQKKMEEDARIIGALSEDFGCVDYVEISENKKNDISVPVRTSGLLLSILPEWERAGSISEKFDLMINRLVYEPDREEFHKATRRETILSELEKSDTYLINARMLIENEVKYYQVQISAVRDDGILTGFVIGTRSIDENTRKELETQRIIKESLKKAEEETQRNDILYGVVKANRWSYEISADDKVLSAKYEDKTEQQVDIANENDPMAWVETIHPEDRERVKDEFMAAIYDHSGNTLYDATFRILGRNGKYLWGRSSGRVLRNEDGTGEYFGMSLDITEQMEEQQKRLLGDMPLSNDVLTKANIGLWAFELDEGHQPRMYDDETMLGLVGLDHQVAPEEAYHAWYDNIDEGSYDLVNDAVNKMIAGEHAEVQYPWHFPDGRTIMVRCGGVRNFEYTKGIRIEGTHQDVTQTLHYDEEERKRAKQVENDLIMEKLRADSLAYISDNEPDLDNAINFFGKRILEISGCDQVVYRELNGRKIVLNVPGNEDVPETICSECPFAQFDCEAFKKDGTVLMDDCRTGYEGIMAPAACPAKSSFMQMVYSGGEVVGKLTVHYLNDYHTFTENGIGIMKTIAIYLGIMIGRIKEKQAEIAKIEAESSNKAKTEFLFNMSHDIRTPMNAILGYTNIALNHIEEPERVNDSLKKIKTSSGHLLSLINDILEMSRIEAGKMEILNAPVNAYEVTESITNMSQALAATKDIIFKTVIDDIKNPYVYADELHTNQIVINLISNAIKYTKPGGVVEYRIEQISDPVDGIARYRISVKDNGIGMSKEFQQHLFESFSRENTSTVSKQEGAGLGLAIVKRILDIIGGTISVKSKQGEGSTFIVELPLKVMDKTEIEDFEASRILDTEVNEDISLKGKKVLLVEDNEMNREIATEILEETGMIIESAEDGALAVKKVREKGIDYYDFILMDIQMPIMDGYEATAEIRKMQDGDKVPIIALSANAFKEDMEKSLAAGMNAHVAKPINVKELFDVLTKFL